MNTMQMQLRESKALLSLTTSDAYARTT